MYIHTNYVYIGMTVYIGLSVDCTVYILVVIIMNVCANAIYFNSHRYIYIYIATLYTNIYKLIFYNVHLTFIFSL